jgi:sugar phosphate permease
MIRSYTSRVFYGWWIVAAAFGVQLLTGGLLQQSYGAYVAVLQDEKGWSKTALAGAFSLIQLIGGVIGPVQGIVMDRMGPRAVMRVGFVIFGAGFLLLSQVETLAAYYGAFVILALGFSLTAFFPLTVALVNWFERKRARVLSTMSLGFAVGGLLVPVVAYSLGEFGWRGTAFGSGILVMAVGLPLAQVMRRRPEDYGEVVDGIREHSEQADGRRSAHVQPPPAAMAPERDFTLREAIRTPAFWLISLGHGSALLVVGAVQVHVISHLKEDLGYSVGSAALVVTLMTLMQVCGMLIGAAVGDRFDKRSIAAVCMCMHMVGMLLVAFAASLIMVVSFAVLHGLAWGIRGPLMQAIRADYFGRSSFGVIMGLSSTIIMLGQIGGPVVAGLMADRTGNYESGFTLMAVLAGLGSGFFIFARRPELPERISRPERAAEPA